MSFSNEKYPLPIPISISDSSNSNNTLIQYYRSSSLSSGIKLTVNSATTKLLPNDTFNILQSPSGNVELKNGRIAVIKQSGKYLHTIIINAFSTYPATGIFIADIINNLEQSINVNGFSSKNINPNLNDPLIITFIYEHFNNDEIQLRIGGGVVPGGGNIEINITSIQWILNKQ